VASGAPVRGGPRDYLAKLRASVDTVNRVSYGGERVVLTRHGRRVAAVVPIEDLELLEALEDARDLDDVRAALADPDNRARIAWDDLKASLNL
jgi:prevent-host-death family protein